jgi:hypothetical protein
LAKCHRELVDLRFSGKQDFLDQSQPGVPAFEFVRVVEARGSNELGD